MNTEKKAWRQSKTIWGSIITLLAIVASLFGYQIDQATQAQLTQQVTAIVAALGSILAIYGRVTATKQLK